MRVRAPEGVLRLQAIDDGNGGLPAIPPLAGFRVLEPEEAMADKPAKEADLEKRIAKLEAELRNATWQITQMQKMGGFADSKTLGTRCTRIEERLVLVELDGDMLKDVAAHQVAFVEHHLSDRHDVIPLDRDDAPDVKPWRRMRARLRTWADKRGLMTKRRDLTDVRHDENRTRPRAVASA